MSKAPLLYAIKSPWYKDIRPFWVAYYARNARRAISESYGEPWSKLYRQGHRVVRVQIHEVGK
jgi:hypothetical protein